MGVLDLDLHGVRDGVPAALAARGADVDPDVRLGSVRGRGEVEGFGSDAVDGGDGRFRGLRDLAGFEGRIGIQQM